MTTGYLPQHGTESRYKGARNGSWDPCRCTTCVTGHTRQCSQRALAHLAGAPPLYPAGPLIGHIQTLADAGMSHDLIARRANVSHTTIRYLMRGITKSCRREKALRILAVVPGDFDREADRPATGTVRRIRALYAIGHNPLAISEAAGGLAPSSISAYANGHYAIAKGPTAAAIAAAYKTLSIRRGTSAKAAARARTEGWHGPLAWGANIDDPAANPDADNPPDPELTRDELAELRRDEIELLATACITDEEIAARVGMAAKSVRSIRTELRTGKRRDRTKAAA